MKAMLLALAWFAAAGVGAQTGEPAVQVSATAVSCFGKMDGRLDLTLTSGAAPVAFLWNNLANGASGNGVLPQIGNSEMLTNLAPGNYRLVFTDANGMGTTVERMVNEPSLLEGKLFVLNNFGGFPVACAYSGNAVALLDAKGGTEPYTISWSNGDVDIRADSLSSGPLSVTITDANGCSFSLDTVLNLPTPLLLDLEVVGEICAGQNSGSIRVESAQGGVPPYRFSLNGGPLTTTTLWTNLPPSPYFIQMEDAAGCTVDRSALLPSGITFTLKLGADTTIFSGDTLRRFILTDPPADTLIWRPAQNVQMLSANEALIFPNFTTTYRVTAMNTDGCMATDEITVTVARSRDIYVPNAFAPKADIAENQVFTVFGGGGIQAVALLQVYDRAGRLWFENRNFPPNDPASGWDGSFRSDEAPVGVYPWRAIVRYTDGREILLQGDVTVIR